MLNCVFLYDLRLDHVLVGQLIAKHDLTMLLLFFRTQTQTATKTAIATSGEVGGATINVGIRRRAMDQGRIGAGWEDGDMVAEVKEEGVGGEAGVVSAI